MIQNLWRKYSVYFHFFGWLITLAFTGGVVWANVAAYDDRIGKLETVSEKREQDIARIDGKLDVLLSYFRLRYSPREDD